MTNWIVCILDTYSFMSICLSCFFKVVHEIDSLTSDLHLEERANNSKTDTLNSSSSSTTTTTTASSIERIKIYPEDAFLRPPAMASGMLTVLKRTHPPLPPPCLMPARVEDHSKSLSSGNQAKENRILMRNGVFSTKSINIHGRDSVCMPKSSTEKGLTLIPLLRHKKRQCPQVTRERVRFSEKVQYHGYCPDCNLQYDIDNTDMHLHSEFFDMKLSPIHQCSSMAPAHVLMENGGLSLSHSFPPSIQPYVPHHATPKPQKTILRKSTSTTV